MKRGASPGSGSISHSPDTKPENTSCIKIIETYKKTDPVYSQLLQTILVNSNFDASALIIQTDQEGKRISIKEVPNDFRDEYTRQDLIIA